MSALFRFDADRHEYTDLSTGEVVPHITQLLERAGLVDTTWCTEESRYRGTQVHRLTADYDLDALDPQNCVSGYKGWLDAHVRAMAVIKPEILKVEEPVYHPRYRYGGRPDRVWRVFGIRAVGEIKSGPPEKAHAIQTALQAILDALDADMPAEMIGRFGLYLQRNGKFKLEEFKNKRDFAVAREIIRATC